MDNLYLGTRFEDGGKFHIPKKDLFTHAHVIGKSGRGKTRLLQAMIQDHIEAGDGVCVIDPDGDLYHSILMWCYENKALIEDLDERLIVFDPHNQEQIIGFNPLATVGGERLDVKAGRILEVFLAVWGQETFQSTPRMARWIYNMAYSLMETNLTFWEANELLSPIESNFRNMVLSRVSNPIIRKELQWLSESSHRIRREEVDSTISRLKLFTSDDILEPILGRNKNCLDIEDVMNNNKILLVNLSLEGGIMKSESQGLLGTMLVNEFLSVALTRKQRTPFYLYIDECHKFITDDIAQICVRGRKYGLHLILSHQNIGQLAKKGDDIYRSIMDIDTKIVFGLGYTSAEAIVKEVYTNYINLKEIKQEIYRRAFEPYIEWVEIESESKGSIVGGGSSVAQQMPMVPHIGYPGLPQRTESDTGFSSDSESITKTLAPIINHREYIELTSREFFSLNDQLYRVTAKLKEQPERHCIIKLTAQEPIAIKVRNVPDAFIEPGKKRTYERNKLHRMALHAANKHPMYYLAQPEITKYFETRKQQPLSLNEKDISDAIVIKEPPKGKVKSEQPPDKDPFAKR